MNRDVIVVGGGNAGLSASIAAAERGRRVVLLERAGRDDSGGNSYYTAGATRFVHAGLDDLRDLIEPDERWERTTVPPYTREDYLGDLARVTNGRNDPLLSETLVGHSSDTVRWLHAHGVRYRLMYERQAYERADGYLFWGGLHVGNVGGGIGLIEDETRAALAAGVEIQYGMRVTGLLGDRRGVRGVRVDTGQGELELEADSVILASGGFEANAELREAHLGAGWRNAKVRGTPYNTGELLLAALELGADRGGDWGTCHSTAWDAWYPANESNRELTNRLTRQSYPLGIYVNRDGERFVDEGSDFRNYTYARFGREILAQPGSIAFQLFDAVLRPSLRAEEYEMPGASVVEADDLDELARGIDVDPVRLRATVEDFNASIDRATPFDPSIKDGRNAHTRPPKSNWAMPIETPPFYAFPVTCGITFTFGGLRGDDHGRVLDQAGTPIPGLYAAGEALGGLFSGNYPGGSGLAAGMVFGRRAGSVA
jgi:tricarballylate dehydrogenase